MRLLWLLPDLGYTAAARQASLVAPALTATGQETTVAVLRAGGAFAPALRNAGVELLELSTPHDLPLRAVYALDALLRGRSFDIVHTWRSPSLRALATIRLRQRRSRIVASQIGRGGRWGILDRLLLPRAERIVPDLGEPGDVLPLAVAPVDSPRPLELPANARVIMCLGPLTPEHGFRDAIWAFDVLKFVVPDLHLVIIGSGPERERLEQFGRAICGQDLRVHFISGGADAAAYLPRATVVWVPSRNPCGEQVALESLAAGVHVVATNLPSLAAVVGPAGRLVPPADPVALAKATRQLLEQPLPAKSPQSGHSPAEVAAAWVSVYQSVAAGPRVC